jgi:hypothetical protein
MYNLLQTAISAYIPAVDGFAQLVALKASCSKPSVGKDRLTMKCPICSKELSKMERTGKDTYPGTVPVHWKCEICGATFSRAYVRPVLDHEQ